ncbi:uncharacterized protein HMPREF1541_07221 [Cyphellophora europaea CBS 101466]|uniref:Seipin n=1 Tax=Cyphellophora europaea (strain CBS 101466) TaxID=1220924 RepID=W2RPE4_CYPE1|nr:uncharacterized protein HMPREF1541_07221 [Cyphellophora europaea CBS 101466]ETN37599.1 hypothetical protein HMPREF1541_07221 [Cyphellophora europaea CBS 101466]
MASPTRSATSDDNERPSPPALTELVRRLLRPLLNPLHAVLSFLSSPAFLRASISTLIFVCVSSLLVATSTTAYLIFYYYYIPPISLSIPLYLQYGVHNTAPYAVAEIPQGTLISQQAYDVRVDLEMPRTPNNLEAGVFMVDVRLLGAFDPVAEAPETLRQLLGNITALGGDGYTVLQHSRRPAMLRYKSVLLGLASEMMNLPFHLVGFKDLDTEKVKVRMWEKAIFRRGSGNVPRGVRVEVATGGATTGLSEMAAGRQVQIYKAGLTFSARFHGLRYLVYNHRIVSFLVLTTTFYVVSIIAVGLGWAWLGRSIMPPESRPMIKQESPPVKTGQNEKQQQQIKTEDEDDEEATGLKIEDVSDSPAQFPSGRGRAPLRYEGRQDDEEGPQGMSAVGQEREVGEGEKADDEEEMDDDEEYARAAAAARTTGRFEGDSGIGTMSESQMDGQGLVRRRSGRSLGEQH